MKQNTLMLGAAAGLATASPCIPKCVCPPLALLLARLV
jgi:hypothetical protein